MLRFLGARPYDFEDKDAGRQVKGVTAWFCDDTAKGAVGMIPWKASYSIEDFAAIYGKLADLQNLAFCPVDVVCNRFGKPETVEFHTEN